MASIDNKHQKKAKSTRAALLDMIEAYLAANPAVTPEAFGWSAIKDTRLVGRLREGGDCTTAKLDAIIRYLSQFSKGAPHGQAKQGEEKN